MENFTVFSYKPGSTILHRLPSWIKILFIPAFNIALFMLDWKVAAFFIPFQAVIFLALGFTPKEQFMDLKPVIWYAVFLYIMNVFMQFYGLWNSVSLTPLEFAKRAVLNAITDTDTAFFCIKFCACVQSCSLMFKTSTSIEIRTGIENIEIAVRHCIPFVKKEPVFALAVSMLINFIPAVFKIWYQLKRAWISRGGKQSPLMVMTLIPQLFSVGLKYSFDTTKALINRGQK